MLLHFAVDSTRRVAANSLPGLWQTMPAQVGRKKRGCAIAWVEPREGICSQAPRYVSLSSERPYQFQMYPQQALVSACGGGAFTNCLLHSGRSEPLPITCGCLARRCGLLLLRHSDCSDLCECLVRFLGGKYRSQRYPSEAAGVGRRLRGCAEISSGNSTIE
jgi:hypothetical protein